jgi:hypothetical protein
MEADCKVLKSGNCLAWEIKAIEWKQKEWNRRKTTSKNNEKCKKGF